MAEKALLGLVVLAAIPVVLFALWADYYGRYLKTARKSIPGFDPKLEKDRIRVAQFCVGLFETVLFLGSIEVAQDYPKICVAVFLTCLFTLGWIRAGLERILTPTQLTPTKLDAQRAANGSKALLFGLVSGLVYMATLLVFVKTAAWTAQAFHFSTFGGAAFIMLAAAAGIFCGLALNFALAPWQMKNSLTVSQLNEEDLEAVRASMEKAGLRNFEYWVVEEPQATAAIAGFAGGKGVFRPALFISRKVLTSLTRDEISAVVAHEAAHVLARHLRKRVLLSASLVVSLTFMAIFCTIAAYTWLPKGGEFQSSTGILFGAMAFFCAFYILQKQSRVHEFQADWLAVHKLGANFESWANGLRKMDALNGFPTLPGSVSSHPRTEIRIQNVAKMIEFFSVMKKAEAKQENEKKDRVA